MPRRRKKRKRRRKVRRKKWKKSWCAERHQATRSMSHSSCVILRCSPPWQLCRFCDQHFPVKQNAWKAGMIEIRKALLLHLMRRYKEANEEATLVRLSWEANNV